MLALRRTAGGLTAAGFFQDKKHIRPKQRHTELKIPPSRHAPLHIHVLRRFHGAIL
jgi:hypothetical protein